MGSYKYLCVGTINILSSRLCAVSFVYEAAFFMRGFVVDKKMNLVYYLIGFLFL